VSAERGAGIHGDPPSDLAADRRARLLARTRFERPLVLEAGAGTGKTTTLIARLLAWCLGPGWEKAAAEGGAEAAAADELVAARVLRGVVALTFTEAAAAEMAARAAADLAGLARGGGPPEWLAGAALPAGAELARRARLLLATLDHLGVETIHAFCLGLLASHPLEAGVHPNLRVDVDGRQVEGVIGETVEAALRPGYGTPGDPHLLALATRGCGPREVADALTVLVASGIPPGALARDPFAGDGWPQLRARLTRAAATLHGLLAPRCSTLDRQLAVRIERGLAGVLAHLAASEPASAAVPSAPASVPPAPTSVPPARSSPPAAAALAGAAAGLGAHVPRRAAPAAAAVAALREAAAGELPPNLVARLKDWRRGRFSAAEAAVLGEVGEAVAAESAAVVRLLQHLERLDPAQLADARRALSPLLAAVHGELTRRGIATFDELLRGARRLLAGHPEVRARLRRGIDQLLVDEFQDTDAVQCEVLRWLALDGPAAARPGLFLVGDPKQSIYGWRSADLRAYEGFVTQVRAAGGEVLALVENFRSVPPILDEVTRIMAPVMREIPGVQPPHVALVPCERRAAAALIGGGRAPVEHWVSWPAAAAATDAALEGAEGEARQPSLAAATALEAEAIAADLVALRAGGDVAWSEMAILLRSTGDLEVYLDALRRAGVPFAVGRDKQYYRRREVIDAAALVRTVVDPADHLALLTFLRSPLVGVPDAALMPLWGHQLPKLLTELAAPSGAGLAAVREAIDAAAREVPPGIPGLGRVAGWEAALLAAVEHLAVLRESFSADPVDRFVERLRRLLLLDVTAAARYLGAYRLANLDRFFRLLLAEVEQGGGDVTAVLRALRHSIADEREAEEGRPLAGVVDAVPVLTIHGAKGLDFTHVYLPQLHKPSKGDEPRAATVGRLDAGDPRAAPAPHRQDAADLDGWEYRLLGLATPGFDLLEERRLEVERAERVRTLYVAATRAKDRLVLAGCWPRRAAAPAPPEHARSHLDLLAWRPGIPDLERLWQEASAPGASATAPAAGAPPPAAARLDAPRATVPSAGAQLDTAGVAWRFPALALVPVADLDTGLDAAPPAAAGPPADGVSPASVALHAARRAAALARMARPFGGAASEEAHAQLREEVAAARAATALAVDAMEPPAVPAGATRAAPEPPGVAAGREVAMAAGAALHRALELWDLTADPVAEAARQRRRLPSYAAAAVSGEGDRLARAVERSGALLDRFVATGLAQRLAALAPQVVARELPVLLPPSPSSPSLSPGAAVGFVSGAIDLLYRDAATGELVIADYKTDEIAPAAATDGAAADSDADADADAGVARRAATYASQGAVYVRAVRAALALPAPPRFELWFVAVGRVVVPPVAGE
jgi:ATP-dependent exoDNAse (exonuclease V) beta subunit